MNEKPIDPESRRARIEESAKKSAAQQSSEGEGDPKKGESTYKQILDAITRKQSASKHIDFSLLKKVREIIARNPRLLGEVRDLNEFLAQLEGEKVVGLDGKPLTETEKARLAEEAKKLRFDRKDIQHKRPPPTFKPF